MYRVHGLSYAEYDESFDQQVKVEKEREKEYQKSMRVVSQLDSKLK